MCAIERHAVARGLRGLICCEIIEHIGLDARRALERDAECFRIAEGYAPTVGLLERQERVIQVVRVDQPSFQC